MLLAYAKTKAQLISAFVFNTKIVQSLYFLHPKFQASNQFQWLYSPVCVEPCWRPEDRFSHDAVQIIKVVPFSLLNAIRSKSILKLSEQKNR